MRVSWVLRHRFHCRAIALPMAIDLAVLCANLAHLLPAGTILLSIRLKDGFVGDELKPALDGWTLLPFLPSGPRVHILGDPAPDDVLDSLRFLVKNHFLAATYFLDVHQERLFIRTYLVPWDLPGSGGVLSLERRTSRDTGALRDAKKHLRRIFSLIRQDAEMWNALMPEASNTSAKWFWPQQPVSHPVLMLQ